MATDAEWAGVLVILKDGKRLGWKISRGVIPRKAYCDHRYFGGHSPTTCTEETTRFDEPDAFSKARAWAAGFLAHPDERGLPPWPEEAARRAAEEEK